MSGLIHLYCGEGKGKTTAAMGAVIRAAGSGKKVVILQFLKSGTSSEVKILQSLYQVKLYALSSFCGFIKNQSNEELKKIKCDYGKLFDQVIDTVQCDVELLVLDEVLAACNHRIIEETKLISFLENKSKNLEVILTGRNPSERLLSLADYITEMKKIKHPFDEGVQARQGIEF